MTDPRKIIEELVALRDTKPGDWSPQHEERLDAMDAAARAFLAEPETKPPRFPTMLRKMWSGGEVQDWINEHWRKDTP